MRKSFPRSLLNTGVSCVLLLLTLVCSRAQSAGESNGLAGLSATIDRMDTELRATSTDLALAADARQRRIASITRLAVVRATAGETDSTRILEIAGLITASAVRAAPEYRETIVAAIGLAPAIARLEGGREQLQRFTTDASPTTYSPAATPAYAAAPPPAYASEPAPAFTSEPAPAVRPAIKRKAEAGTSRPPEKRTAKEEAQSNVSRSAASEDDEELELTLKLGENTAFSVSADFAIDHDNNIFLTAENEVADTIFTLTPGFGFRFGRSALAGGSIAYQQSFVRYADESAPSASLGAGSAQFAYDNGRSSYAASFSFRQVNQNSRETAGEQILQRDLLDLSVGAELGLGTKMRLRSGASFNSTDYRSSNLIGSQQLEIPLRLFFAMTPRTSLSLGTSYRSVRPRGVDAGPSGRDLFYNFGIRGALAPKLSGDISFGYRTRSAGQNPSESLWGFDGSVALETSVKTSLSFLFARDFNTGALGESLQNNRFSLRFTAAPTDQWALGAVLSYATADYGLFSFTESNLPVTTFRADKYWEGGIFSSYNFTTWFLAGADFTVRSNNSNASLAEFSNQVLKLNLKFTY